MKLPMVLAATAGLAVLPMFAEEEPCSAPSDPTSLDTGGLQVASAENVPFVDCFYTTCDWCEGVKLRTDEFKGLYIILK